MKKIFLLLSIFCSLFFIFCNNKPNEKKESTADSAKSNDSATNQDLKNIVFFGNSLTAAFGLNPSEGFAGRIGQRIDSMKLGYKTINAGLSGETTAAGAERVDWVIGRQKVNIFILELGGNDALRGLKTTESEKNLQTIIDKVKAKYPDCKILLAGMMAPPNMGKKYADDFKNVYTKIAKSNNLPLIPFLLEGVGGIPRLNLPDGIHPTAEGHRIVTENIWTVLKPML
jgi:acyl-CoA thioesterase-1